MYEMLVIDHPLGPSLAQFLLRNVLYKHYYSTSNEERLYLLLNMQIVTLRLNKKEWECKYF